MLTVDGAVMEKTWVERNRDEDENQAHRISDARIREKKGREESLAAVKLSLQKL